MATTVTSLTASRAASATAPPAIAIAITTAAAGTSLPCTFGTGCTRLDRRNYSIHTVEVRLVIRVELGTTFDHCRGCALRHCRGRA